VRIVCVAVIVGGWGAAGCDVAERVVDSGPPPAVAECNSWRQWGNNAAHDGASCVVGQPLHGMLSDMVYDPFLGQEVADARGDLLVHYQAPLIDGDDVYMMTKHGVYTPCRAGPNGPSCFEPDERYRLGSQIWAEQGFALRGDGVLVLQWSFDSDWKPEPQIGFEPLFQPALAGGLIAIPGAGGALWELDRISGAVVRHVQPFGDAIDPDTYVAGGIAVGPDGMIYYNAIELDHDRLWLVAAHAWLVAVAPDGSARTADYAQLIPTPPLARCYLTYPVHQPLPWPPLHDDGTVNLPGSAVCEPQRPGINSAPAVAADGTIFVASRSHDNARYAYVAAIGPT
jgi:hypothetical protein